eukprot:scaffold42194_cov35-Tisochrysis_lutea.AAC.1
MASFGIAISITPNSLSRLSARSLSLRKRREDVDDNGVCALAWQSVVVRRVGALRALCSVDRQRRRRRCGRRQHMEGEGEKGEKGEGDGCACVWLGGWKGLEVACLRRLGGERARRGGRRHSSLWPADGIA